jgi:hypothetical protein
MGSCNSWGRLRDTTLTLARGGCSRSIGHINRHYWFSRGGIGCMEGCIRSIGVDRQDARQSDLGRKEASPKGSVSRRARVCSRTAAADGGGCSVGTAVADFGTRLQPHYAALHGPCCISTSPGLQNTANGYAISPGLHVHGPTTKASLFDISALLFRRI